jgi:DNA-binding SARP family transcriptional activator
MANRPAVPYRIDVLGPVAVHGPDGVVDLGGHKPRLVFALLVASADHEVSADRLIDRVWCDEPPPTCRKTLQVHISHLRRSLGAGVPLETTRFGYRLRTAGRISIDAVDFEREVRDAEAVRGVDPALASTQLAAALARWRGPAYEDVAEEPAMRAEATRLDELRLLASERRIDAELAVGRHGGVLCELERLIAEHPYHERFRAQHVLALYRCGRQADALRAFERARATLADDLGIDPGRDLRDLHRQVLDQSSELDVRAVVTVATVGASADVAPRPCVSPEVGVRVRGYDLLEQLGERAGSTVFRAYQTAVGREVALRVIAPVPNDRDAFLRRFEEECRLLARLEHPHVVPVHDFWTDEDGHAFLTMQLMPGGTLEQSCRRRTYSPRAALRIVQQVGEALAHAHRHGSVHGDVRPSNVLLDASGNAYVSDFVLDGPGPGPGHPAPEYLAPEQREGRPPGPAADIYALGVLASVLLTGLAPGDLDSAVDRDAVDRDALAVPADIVEIVRRATAERPIARFEQVDDLLDAIAGVRQRVDAVRTA